MLHTGYERSIWRSPSVDTWTGAYRRSPLHRSMHHHQRQRPTTFTAKDILCMWAPAAACEHRRRACRPCRMQSEVFMRASTCVAARRFAWNTNRVQRRQSARRRARPPSSPRRCCERLLPAHAECTRQSSAVQAFRMGPSVGTAGGDPCALCSAECACGKRDVRSRHIARGVARG